MVTGLMCLLAELDYGTVLILTHLILGLKFISLRGKQYQKRLKIVVLCSSSVLSPTLVPFLFWVS